MLDASHQRRAGAIWHARAAEDAYERGCFDEAVRHLDSAVERGLEDPEVRLSRAAALLTMGALEEGFLGAEARFEIKGDPITEELLQRAAPLWAGEFIHDRRLLVWMEQGYGDAILFSRFLPEVRKRVAAVAAVVPPELVNLFRASFDVEVITSSEITEEDVHCRFGSLPRLLGVRGRADLWSGPYLRAPAPCPALTLTPTIDLKVGLCWSGNRKHPRDRHRSVSVSTLSPIVEVEGACFFPLLMPHDETRPTDGDASWWVDVRKSIRDFADTAALVQQLDLVITVDTAVANLAGALGRPAWVLLPFVSDWRWGAEGSESAWYPTLHLWRQAAPGDWATVIERVRQALESLVRSRRPGPASDLSGLVAPPCKCCSGTTRWFGAVAADYLTYSHSLAERTDGCFDYWRCEACWFLFSTHFDGWTDERMRTELYNDEFFELDDGWRQRPRAAAEFLELALRPLKVSVRILDYGGGRGLLAELLKGCGFEQVDSFDPFYDPGGRPAGRVDIVTSFEVLEHALDPHAMLQDIETMLEPDGVFIFSTLVQPKDMAEIGLSWWYAKPRVGHVSLHSRLSLAHCAALRGWTFESFSAHLHAMYRVRPSWMQRFANLARGRLLVST